MIPKLQYDALLKARHADSKRPLRIPAQVVLQVLSKSFVLGLGYMDAGIPSIEQGKVSCGMHAAGDRIKLFSLDQRTHGPPAWVS